MKSFKSETKQEPESEPEPESSYPVDLTVEYATDDAYRKTICQLFRRFGTQTAGDLDDDGGQTSERVDGDRDYNDTHFYACVDFLKSRTLMHSEFRDLYVAAAGLFMMDDHETGIVVLLCYDYFAAYHRLLCAYFTDNPYHDRLTALMQEIDVAASKKDS
jgi:hypothetical protein